MLIDCDACVMRGPGCRDCVVRWCSDAARADRRCGSTTRSWPPSTYSPSPVWSHRYGWCTRSVVSSRTLLRNRLPEKTKRPLGRVDPALSLDQTRGANCTGHESVTTVTSRCLRVPADQTGRAATSRGVTRQDPADRCPRMGPVDRGRRRAEEGTDRAVSIGRINRTKGIALAAITTTAVAAGVFFIQGAADADPKPTLEQAKAQVAALQHKAEVAGESANELRGQITASQARVKALQAGIAKQQAQVDAVKRQIGSLAVAGYQTSGMSTTAQLLLSTQPRPVPQPGVHRPGVRRPAELGAPSSSRSPRASSPTCRPVSRPSSPRCRPCRRKQDGLKKQLAGEPRRSREGPRQAQRRRAGADRRRRTQERRRRRASSARAATATGPATTRTCRTCRPAAARRVAVNAALDQLGDSYVWGAAGPELVSTARA